MLPKGQGQIGILSIGIGFYFGLLLVGCVSASFNYKFYKPEAVSWTGTLLGATPKDDLAASVCEIEGACVVMLKDAFFALKLDYEDMQNQLTACQKPK